MIKHFFLICLAILALVSFLFILPAPPIRLSVRQGILTDQVLQILNESPTEYVKVKVLIFNSDKSGQATSALFTIPPGQLQEIGRLEFSWNLKSGDYGYIESEQHLQRLYFRLLDKLYYYGFHCPFSLFKDARLGG